MNRGLFALKVLGIASLVFAAPSCSRGKGDVLLLTTTDGRNIADVVPDSGGTILLVYEPYRCYSCSTLLSSWEERSKMLGLALRLVMSEEPDANEWRTLRRERIPVVGVLDARSQRRLEAPAEFLFRGRELVARAEGGAAVRKRALLDSAHVLLALRKGNGAEVARR